MYLPARSWFVVFDKLNITVYYQAYPNKIKRQPGDTDYLTSRCTYRTWRRHESRNWSARCHARLGGSGGRLISLRLRLSVPGSAQPQVPDASATGINKEINKPRALWGNGGGELQTQIEPRSIFFGRGRGAFWRREVGTHLSPRLERNQVVPGGTRSLAGGKRVFILFKNYYYFFSKEKLLANDCDGASVAGYVWDAITQCPLADLHRSNYWVIAEGK